MKQNKTLDQWGPIDAKILYMSFWFEPIANSGKNKWQAAWPNIQGVFKKDRITYIWDKEDMESRGTWVINNIILDNKQRKKLWQEYQSIVNRIYKFAEKIIKLKRKVDSDKKLYNAIRSYAIDLYKILTSAWYLGIIPELANFAAQSYLTEKLSSEIPKNKIQKALVALLTSEKLSYHQQSEYELLIAAKKNNFISHADKWFWVENGYFESKVLTTKDFKDQVNSFSKSEIKNKLQKIKKYPKLVDNRKKRIINQYNLSSRVVTIANNLAQSIWWQDHRKSVALFIENTIDIFSQAVATELKIDFDKILYYRAEEWLDLFSKKPIRVSGKILTKRYNLSLFEINVKKAEFSELHGKKARKKIDSWNLKKRYISIKDKELKGTSVSLGKVSGKVKILLSYRQVDKIKKGEILVVPMTSPDYIIAMRKAAAIITDVGGLMSHAAIISRELGIPCIVGTQIATKVLKDGDKVLVDADKGVVKKI